MKSVLIAVVIVLGMNNFFQKRGFNYAHSFLSNPTRDGYFRRKLYLAKIKVLKIGESFD